MCHIVFPGPDELYGFTDGFGNLHGLGDEIDIDTATKTAAEKGGVNLYFFFGEPRDLHRNTLGHLRKLGGAVKVAAVGAHVGREIHGLHGGVGQEGQRVARFELPGGTGHGGIDIAFFIEHGSGFAECGSQTLSDAGRGKCRTRPIVPSDIECVAGGFGEPE